MTLTDHDEIDRAAEPDTPPAAERPAVAIVEEPIVAALELDLTEVFGGQPSVEPVGGSELDMSELFAVQSAAGAVAAAAETDLGDAGLAEMFRVFEKGLERQLDEGDYGTRYDLGIAFKEEGLIDEAIAEFMIATEDENRVLDCSSMLGLCFMEKGMPDLAMSWFENGLAAIDWWKTSAAV